MSKLGIFIYAIICIPACWLLHLLLMLMAYVYGWCWIEGCAWPTPFGWPVVWYQKAIPGLEWGIPVTVCALPMVIVWMFKRRNNESATFSSRATD